MPLADAVAQLAIEFQTSPASIRAWDWIDFMAVQRAYGRRNEEVSNGKTRA